MKLVKKLIAGVSCECVLRDSYKPLAEKDGRKASTRVFAINTRGLAFTVKEGALPASEWKYEKIGGRTRIEEMVD